DAGALDGAEVVRPVDVAELRWLAGVVSHRIPTTRPVKMPDESPRQWVVFGHDAEQVVHLSLEPPGRKRQSGQTWHVRVRGVERHVQFDATVRVGGGEQVDDAQLLAVIVPGYQRDPESVGEQVGCRGEQVV